jgi:RNase P subunit RPR2
MSCIRCRGFLVREASHRLDIKGEEMPPTVRCVNCGYLDNSVFRVNRLNFHMARIHDDASGHRAASPPKKRYLARGARRLAGEP